MILCLSITFALIAFAALMIDNRFPHPVTETVSIACSVFSLILSVLWMSL